MDFYSLPYQSDLLAESEFSKNDLPADLLDMPGLFGKEESYDLQNTMNSITPMTQSSSSMYKMDPFLPPVDFFGVSDNTPLPVSVCPGDSHVTSHDVSTPSYVTACDTSYYQEAWTPELGEELLDSGLPFENIPVESGASLTILEPSPSTDVSLPMRVWDDDSNHSYEEAVPSASSSISQSQPVGAQGSSRTSQVMTDEEKYQRIRKLNRKTSSQYRTRCKEKMANLEEEMNRLVIDNQRLEKKAEKLEALRDEMKDLIGNVFRMNMGRPK
ncbi:uncharacterized protein LOC143036541 [Oratosquilla oratoria]|uniref:uncharacterized protein LOC143036541 n=1 Tax=Oratosquilla oratoria TaxID=337810 RepID=UPI003F767835